jgi:hypothetical protein
MPNTIKYSTTGDTLSLKKGNFFIGTGDVGKGPTSATTYWNGISPPSGGYSVYKNKVSNGPAIWTAASDNQLVSLTNNIEGTSFTTTQQCINYFATQSDKMVLNKDYEKIVTDGLVLNLDAGFLPSYGGSGTTWYDLAYSGNNGTLTNGPTYSSLDGGGIVFDGVDDYIAIPSSISSLSGTTQATLEMWLKLTNGSNTSNISGLIQLSDFNNSNGNLYFYTDAARVGGIWLDIFRTNRLFTGDWRPVFDPTIPHNLVVTTQPGTNGWKMYLNGSLRYQSTGQDIVYINSSLFGGLRIGQNGGGRELKGNVYSTKIYNRALTSAEILQNYNASISRFNTSNIVKNGLVLNLDSSNTVSYPTSGTTWTDLSGNGYHGTLINGPTFDSTSKSIVFDGTNDYVSCGTQIGNFGTSNFTINFLFKTGEQSAPSTFVAKSIGGSPTSDYGWLVNNGSDGTNLGFAIASANVNWGTNGSYVIQTSGATINNNTWQMATIVGDRSQPNVSIYLNGVLQNLKSYVATTAPFTSLGNVTNDKIFAIGSESDISSSPYPIEANIEALRIYDRSLSQSEVLQNYYQAPIVTSGLVMSLDAGNLVSYSGAGTTWGDLTTNGYIGMLTNGPTFNTDGGGTIVFDGIDDYTQLGDVLDLGTNNLTINMWIKLSSSPSENMYIFSKAKAAFQAYRYGFRINQNKIAAFFQGNLSGSDIAPVGNTVLSVDTWYMVTIVFNRSSNITMYVNGIQETLTGDSTISQWNNLNFQSDNPARIGSYTSGDNTSPILPFKGSISTVQVYFDVLTQSEIAQNYNAYKSRFGL